MVKNNKSSLSSFFLAKWLWCIFSQSFGYWTNNTIHQKSEWTSSIPNYGRRGKMVAWILQQSYPQNKMIVPPLRGSINVFQWLTQGLRPGLCRSIAPLGLIARPHQSPPHHNPYNHNQTKTRTNATIHLHTQKHLTNTIPRHNSANAQSDKEPCKGGTPAKPRVEWGQSPIWNPG